ncbi:WxL protein peptidoglycan domain-containing protein [Streptomyces boninensis]|uniref:COG1470 family protein n=1 Tax=Streptomyces boninensis TaxID=2039455 RepID=UPI003B2111B9
MPIAQHTRARSALAALALLGLVLGVFAAFPAQRAHAADNGQWSVFPAKSKSPSRKGADAAYFHLKADPGATLRDKVTVRNLATEARTFQLYGADAYNTPRDGGFAIRSRAEKQRTVGVWAHLARTEIKVPARGKVTVPFTLRVPKDAEPGDHPGAIVAIDKRVARAKGTGVGVQQAVGARLYLQVNGERKPGLAVEGVRFDYDIPALPGFGDDATISYTVANRGNVMLKPRIDVKAKGLFGRTSFDAIGKKLPAELLPGQEVRVTEKWSGPPPVDWGKIQLSASDKDGELVASGAADFRTVNWLGLAGIGLVVVVLIALGVAARRRARRRGRVAVPVAARTSG